MVPEICWLRSNHYRVACDDRPLRSLAAWMEVPGGMCDIT